MNLRQSQVGTVPYLFEVPITHKFRQQAEGINSTIPYR